MKPFIIPLIILAVLIIGTVMFFLFSQHPAPALPGETREIEGRTYRLTFYDDFDGDRLDRAKWSCCPEWKRGNIGGYWSDKCTSLDGNGHLVLTALKDEKGVLRSGAVRSKGKFKQCRGYFEARCKLQSAHGLWTAFWLMCPEEMIVTGDAVSGAEIDIYESFDLDRGKINHAIHYDGYGKDHKCRAKEESRPDVYDGEFHTFSLLWTDDAYIFYIDGEEVQRFASSDPDYPGCSTAAAYLKLSVECGTWAGKIVDEELPDEALTVDYVKVYEADE